MNRQNVYSGETGKFEYTEDKCYTKDKSSSPPLYQTA